MEVFSVTENFCHEPISKKNTANHMKSLYSVQSYHGARRGPSARTYESVLLLRRPKQV